MDQILKMKKSYKFPPRVQITGNFKQVVQTGTHGSYFQFFFFFPDLSEVYRKPKDRGDEVNISGIQSNGSYFAKLEDTNLIILQDQNERILLLRLQLAFFLPKHFSKRSL